MLDVYRLRLLRELDRRGTLAAVARALSYSPSAISQQLRQLEAETGVRLLEPVGRGVRLTPLARILVTHTEAILERLEEAEAELRAASTEVRGTLRVASFQSVLFALIPSVLTRLAERHPGLRLEITHEQAIPAFEGLLAHEFDLVIGEEYPGVARPPVAGARTRLLARDELFLVLPSHGRYAVSVPAAGAVPAGGPGGRPVDSRPAVDRPRRVGARTPAGRRGSSLTSATPALTCCSRFCWRNGGTPPRSYRGCCFGRAATGRAHSAHPRPSARRLTTGVRAGAAGQPGHPRAARGAAAGGPRSRPARGARHRLSGWPGVQPRAIRVSSGPIQVRPSISSRAASRCPAWVAVSVMTCRMTSRTSCSRQSWKYGGQRAGGASRLRPASAASDAAISCR